MESRPQILVIDFGSQTAGVIPRTLSEVHFRSAIFNPEESVKWLQKGPARGIILSGGDKCVNGANALKLPPEVLAARCPDGRPVPILGICYGHQLLAQALGGRVDTVGAEHGRSGVEVDVHRSRLFQDLPSKLDVWSNHSDSVVILPPNFREVATSTQTSYVAAIESRDYRFFGVQFHPEVPETTFGKEILLNFVEKICGCRKDWELGSIISSIGQEMEKTAGNGTVVIPYSGGVDSSVVAAIAVRALWTARVFGVTVDANNLREGEPEEIHRHAALIGLNHKIADAHKDVALFAHTIDAEKKRDIFKGMYVSHIKKEISARVAICIFDGTLAPDMIESGEAGGVLIKSHHNANIDYGVPVFRPLRNFFKHSLPNIGRRG